MFCHFSVGFSCFYVSSDRYGPDPVSSFLWRSPCCRVCVFVDWVSVVSDLPVYFLVVECPMRFPTARLHPYFVIGCRQEMFGVGNVGVRGLSGSATVAATRRSRCGTPPTTLPRRRAKRILMTGFVAIRSRTLQNRSRSDHVVVSMKMCTRSFSIRSV